MVIITTGRNILNNIMLKILHCLYGLNFNYQKVQGSIIQQSKKVCGKRLP